MAEMIKYLQKNKEVISKVKEGKASLIGISREEEKVILDSFDGERTKSYYWM
ncbi:hypothetical protein L3i20_v207950 [Paenibacillus sp. L3-i20]|nr:hypothetical protein L3i20_v207950 [Paenibacillus sp. L3-i20]